MFSNETKVTLVWFAKFILILNGTWTKASIVDFKIIGGNFGLWSLLEDK